MHKEREIRFWLGICLVLALACGAQASPKQSSKTVEVGELGRQVRVLLNVGDTLRVILPANASTGYRWQVAGNDATILQLSGSKNLAGGEQRPGAVGKQSLTFVAKTAGKDRLVLNYSRPWEKNARPAQSYAVEVTVGADNYVTPTVIPAGTLLGTYGGKLPCADCSGIQTTVAFYAAGPLQLTDTYYVRTMKYLGAPNGDVTSVDAGNWSQKLGTPADPNALLYSLRSNESNRLEDYRLRGDTLVAIGSDGKPIPAPFNINLEKEH